MKRIVVLIGLVVGLIGLQAQGALIHRWSFTSDAGDSVGGINGTLMNGASIDPSGGLVWFDGSDDYVNLPSNPVAGLTSVTIEFWGDVIWASGSQPERRVFDFGTQKEEGGQLVGDKYLSFTAVSSDWTEAPCRISDGSTMQVVSTTPAGDGSWGWNTWQYIAIVIDATGAKIYRNGFLAGINPDVTLDPSDLGTLDNFWFGRSMFEADPYFRGGIDEFRIWNTALSADTIVEHRDLGPDVVPEPATMGLLIFGAGLLSRRRR